MQAQTTTYSVEENLEAIEENSNIKTYLLDPLKIGIMGFAAFFSIILITSTFGYLFGFQDSFSVGLNEVIYSLTGFVFAAGSKFMAFFSND